MNTQEHRKRHQELHEKLDELVADCIRHKLHFRPSKSTVMELMEWSHQQTIKPTEEAKCRNVGH